jgi:hypothetical protein
MAPLLPLPRTISLDDALFRGQREAMDQNKPLLDDPEQAKFAWARYRKMLFWMVLVAILASALAVLWLHNYGSGLTIHAVIATLIAVGLTIIVAAALMGLAFLSSGTHHDEAIEDAPYE